MEKTLNLGIFAHVDAGKTTLTEQILYRCGAIRTPGSVDAGTAQTDRMKVERERGISVRAASASVVFEGASLNIIDTPGHKDFAGECERALSALDCAVLVVSAVEGVQPHTESLWYAIRQSGLPCVLYVNKLDRAGADFPAVSSELTQMDRRNCGEFPPMRFPSASLPDDPDGFSVPSLTEALADLCDDIAEDYLEGRQTPLPVLLVKTAEKTREKEITPVVCGSAKLGSGILPLLRLLASLACEAPAGDAPLSAYVYKLEHDPMFGHSAHVRVFSGTLRARETVQTRRPDGSGPSEDKPTLLRGYTGAHLGDTPLVRAGQIAAVYGLKNIRPGDFLGEVYGGHPACSLANPYMTVRLTPEAPEKLTPLVEAVSELSEEEPRLGFVWEKTTRQLSINVSGEVQTEIIATLLEERYGLKPLFSAPSVIYRETPTHAGRGYEAYTMPKPCWAIVEFRFEPLPRGSGVVYDGGSVPHNQLFYKYQTHIRTSFYDSLKQGIKGWEVTDFRCTLVGGEHHTVHTHPLDFFVATPVAFLNGLVNCGTTYLEPMLLCRIAVPEELLGRVLGDVVNMRGEFDSPVIADGTATFEARLPVSSSMEYPVRLASQSAGKARFFSRFDSWRDCPDELAQPTPYRGVCPLDRARWILWARGAFTLSDKVQ